MSYTKEQLQETANRAMDSFNANDVAKVMDILGRTWYGSETDNPYGLRGAYTPEAGDIRRKLRELVSEVVERVSHRELKSYYTGTGGLCVEYSEGYFEISFRIEHHSYDVSWLAAPGKGVPF